MSESEREGYEAARLAPYRKPVPEAIQRGLAIEDAITSLDRAVLAVVSASLGEPDVSRTESLRGIYIDLRHALADLRDLNGETDPAFCVVP